MTREKFLGHGMGSPGKFPPLPGGRNKLGMLFHYFVVFWVIQHSHFIDVSACYFGAWGLI